MLVYARLCGGGGEWEGKGKEGKGGPPRGGRNFWEGTK